MMPTWDKSQRKGLVELRGPADITTDIATWILSQQPRLPMARAGPQSAPKPAGLKDFPISANGNSLCWLLTLFLLHLTNKPSLTLPALPSTYIQNRATFPASTAAVPVKAGILAVAFSLVFLLLYLPSHQPASSKAANCDPETSPPRLCQWSSPTQ